MSRYDEMAKANARRLMMEMISECQSDAALVTAGLVLGSASGVMIAAEKYTAEGIVLAMDDDGWKEGAILSRALLYCCKFGGIPVSEAAKECLGRVFFGGKDMKEV